MRKSVAILLLSCLFICESGYLAIYLFRQYTIKKEMKAYIRDHPLEQGKMFSFKLESGNIIANNFHWVNANEEFSIDGELYDVVSIKKLDGSVVIHAISDKDEQQLLADFAKHQKGKSNTSLIQLITSVFIQQDIHPKINIPVLYLSHHHNLYISFLQEIALPVQLPPPDVI